MREFHPTVPDRGTHPPKHSGTFDANRSGQCGLQHLYRVLAFVESGDGINVQIHTQPWADYRRPKQFVDESGKLLPGL